MRRTLTRPSHGTIADIASCPSGARAFGGGVAVDDFWATTALSGIRATAPVAAANGAPTGWRASVFGLVGLPQNTAYHEYVICA